VVHAKRPFANPEAVLAVLARYTDRVAVATRRPPSSAIAHDTRSLYAAHSIASSARSISDRVLIGSICGADCIVRNDHCAAVAPRSNYV
jgi:hypothetical protein